MSAPFRHHPESSLFDDEAFGFTRGEYLYNRQRLYERLACAQLLDKEAMTLMFSWLGELKRFHDANAEPMHAYYFHHYDEILEQLRMRIRYDPNQRADCELALQQILAEMRKYENRA